jgi:hypothetical protein
MVTHELRVLAEWRTHRLAVLQAYLENGVSYGGDTTCKSYSTCATSKIVSSCSINFC